MLSQTGLEETHGETRPGSRWMENGRTLRSQPSESPDKTINGGTIGNTEHEISQIDS